MDKKTISAEEHFGLVHACCKHFSGRGIEYEELFSAGCLGLAKAISKFEAERNLKFSTYAVPVIMGEIKRLFRDGGAVKVSRSLKELSLKINRLNSKFRSELGRDMTISELAQRLEVSEEKICEAQCSSKIPLSLTAEYDEDGNPQIDVPVDDCQEKIAEALSLRQAVAQLEERDRKIIELRYYRNRTQSEAARELSMTQVQVSRRERKILGIIREKMG